MEFPIHRFNIFIIQFINIPVLHMRDISNTTPHQEWNYNWFMLKIIRHFVYFLGLNIIYYCVWVSQSIVSSLYDCVDNPPVFHILSFSFEFPAIIHRILETRPLCVSASFITYHIILIHANYLFLGISLNFISIFYLIHYLIN